MRYALLIEYDGRGFGGWQRQKNAPSVQEKLEDALSDLFGAPTPTVGSGRTDAGVHALGQVAHFDAETDIPLFKIKFALNARLPEEIRIKEVYKTAPGFHAIDSVKKKTYLYRLYVSEVASPLRSGFYTRVSPPLDIELMRRAADKLVGEHDFRAFSSTGSDAKTSVRTIYRIDIVENKDEIFIEIEGNGFLYNMVRIISGTLVAVAKGKIPLENIDIMLESGDRRLGGKTFPAGGLVLKSVDYGDDGAISTKIP